MFEENFVVSKIKDKRQWDLIQEYLFDNGFHWSSTGTNVTVDFEETLNYYFNESPLAIYVWKHKTITHSRDSYRKEVYSEAKTISAKKFIKKYIQNDELPNEFCVYGLDAEKADILQDWAFTNDYRW